VKTLIKKQFGHNHSVGSSSMMVVCIMFIRDNFPVLYKTRNPFHINMHVVGFVNSPESAGV
jgi:hypothetical protein